MYILTKKLKALKHALKDWSSKTFNKMDDAVVPARNNLPSIQEEIATYRHLWFTSERFQVEVDANLKVQHASRNQCTLWRDKACVKWLTNGDKCTQFFHT